MSEPETVGWSEPALTARRRRPRLLGFGTDSYFVAPAVQVAIGDAVVLLAAYAVAYQAMRGQDVFGAAPLTVLSATLLALWVPIAMHMGGYKPEVLRDALRSAYTTFKATIVAGAVFQLVPAVGSPPTTRSTALWLVCFLAVAAAAWRACVANLLLVTTTARPLVVIGAGWAGRSLAEALNARPDAMHRIVAFVDDDPALRGTVVHSARVHAVEELRRLVQVNGPRTAVVFAITHGARAEVYDLMTALAQAGTPVLPMASVFEQATGRVPVQHLGNMWWAVVPRAPYDLLYLAGKRVTDLAFALAGLFCLGLLLPLVWIPLRRETGGSLFFSQPRVGARGRRIVVRKLRTLPVRSSAELSVWDRKRANQASRLGALLRATGLDELPQCINILQGDMSVVGPRPFVEEEVAHLQEAVPLFGMRSLVNPGLTGWAQVNSGYGLSLDEELEKFQHDLYYVTHRCFYLDLLILWRTVRLVATRRRRFQVN